MMLAAKFKARFPTGVPSIHTRRLGIRDGTLRPRDLFTGCMITGDKQCSELARCPSATAGLEQKKGQFC